MITSIDQQIVESNSRAKFARTFLRAPARDRSNDAEKTIESAMTRRGVALHPIAENSSSLRSSRIFAFDVASAG
jgi:hypothetical protein